MSDSDRVGRSCSPCTSGWFQILQAWREYEDHKQLVESLAYESAKYDDLPPSEAMFAKLDTLRSRVKYLQQFNPIFSGAVQ
jgi:hypothetical protein